ncbi:hypothetical protein Ahy_B01g055645 [Arachis hypogaea]|uniref:Aminotransferase-like plant mobile domain-containing protein n=1 Tax=Arachis hypogaea TaxID=3818 RepID=A0A445AWS6_ARAHY|nr:hypothetical protein Ahy_B01g055645 [Arachis hypogaea]
MRGSHGLLLVNATHKPWVAATVYEEDGVCIKPWKQPRFMHEQSTRIISGVRRQQNMSLHDRIIPYLETADLYHLARLNSQWFWVDEPLLSAFIERWRPETHTFHMPFEECTITLQDVAYQLGLPIDGEPVSGCLTDFENLMKNGRPAWVWFRELFGELSPQNKVKQMTVNCPK